LVARYSAPTNEQETAMATFGFDADSLITQFSEASARQGEALRSAVQEATLKALQGRELTLANIKGTLKQVSQAAAQGAGQNPMGADQMEPLLAKAIAGMDEAVLQAVEANRRALQQLVDQGATLRETQVKKAIADIEKMEDAFFDTVRKSVQQSAGPLGGAWEGVLDKLQMKGSGTGARAALTVEELTQQAQNTMRQSRAAGVKAMGALLDSYAALASGVLIGMAEGMQGKPAATPAKKKR
jgi:hypothetical protein